MAFTIRGNHDIFALHTLKFGTFAIMALILFTANLRLLRTFFKYLMAIDWFILVSGFLVASIFTLFFPGRPNIHRNPPRMEMNPILERVPVLEMVPILNNEDFTDNDEDDGNEGFQLMRGI
ncbi:unnamed protein product [Larinioides sclopetarius]|uniref:Uncharacterized protein n=1 Tax=Larinioides sclopetarius TaxID=280406 RepID=A0AAV2B273_9ARAC